MTSNAEAKPCSSIAVGHGHYMVSVLPGKRAIHLSYCMAQILHWGRVTSCYIWTFQF